MQSTSASCGQKRGTARPQRGDRPVRTRTRAAPRSIRTRSANFPRRVRTKKGPVTGQGLYRLTTTYNKLFPSVRVWGTDASAEIPANLALGAAGGDVIPISLVQPGVGILLIESVVRGPARRVDLAGCTQRTCQVRRGDAGSANLEPAKAAVKVVHRGSGVGIRV